MATFFNQASLIRGNQITNSNVTEGVLTEVLSASKTALNSSYAEGESIAYAINIVNTGAVPFTNVTITDNLGAYDFTDAGGTTLTLYPLTYVTGSVKLYINGVLQATTPTVNPGPPLEFGAITVPANSNVTVIYEATPNEYAPLSQGSTITNVAVVDGTDVAEPITLTDTVGARDTLNLTIAKALCPTTVTDNGQLTYTFIIQNTGNEAIVASDDVIVTDNFNPILNPISVTFNGTTWTEGVNYTYDETTGAFATLPGQITVPASSYVQNSDTGVYSTTPGVSIITVLGTV